MKGNAHSKGRILYILSFLFWTQAGAQPVSFTLKNEPVENAFSAIQAQSPYKFIYAAEQMQGLPAVTLTIHKAPLSSALNQLLRDLPLSYSIEDGYVFIKKLSKSESGFFDVSGHVMDDKGNDLSRATISLEGSNRATITDNKGLFTMTNVNQKSNLIITSIGFSPQTVPINGRSRIEVQLNIAVNSLDETVIMAYGTTTKRLNTGTINKVKGEDIAKQPVINPLAAIEGRVPGLYIQQNTGVPGGAFKVTLRGQNSITAGNDPLFLVDGVPYPASPMGSAFSGGIIAGGNPLSNINPADIESIEVLKDADATAIYGSRGANGVIMITTRKGKAGNTLVNLDIYSGTGTVPRKIDLLDTRQYLEMRKEALNNDSAQPLSYNSQDLLLWDSTRYTDWQKELISGRAKIFHAQASVTGGNDQTQFLWSGGYNRQGTVFPGEFHDQKLFSLINLHHSSSNKRFNIVFNQSFTTDQNNLLRVDLTSYALSLAPNAPAVYTPEGKLDWTDGFTNPFSAVLQTYKGKSESQVANGVFSYELLKGLQLSTNLGYTKTRLDETIIYPSTSLSPNTPTEPFSNFASNTTHTWIVEPQLSYHYVWSKHKIKVLAGTTFQSNEQDAQSLEATGYNSDALLQNMAAASRLTVTNQSHSTYHYYAVFGRVNYCFNEKYLLNVTGRRDASSRFGPSNQFANFGALGLGYIFSREKFISSHFPVISFAKLKSSYGITGNDQIGDYGYLNTFSTTQYPYLNSIGLIPTQLFNPFYGWESNKKIELGLDLGFFQNTVNLSFNWYRNRSSNLLIGSPLPFITGFGSINNNLPAIVQNTGLEIEGDVSLQPGQFGWTVTFNYAAPRNKLLSYPLLASSNDANTYVVGQSLFVQKKYHYTEVNKQTGQYSFEDVDKDGKISYPNDLTSLKQLTQDYFGGIENKLTYKGLELAVFLQYVKQSGLSYLSGFPVPGMPGNQPVEVLQRWQKPGDVTNVQAFTQAYGTSYLAYFNYQNMSDATIVDASFIRIKNLNLSYQLPLKWLQKAGITGCRVYSSCQNLFTHTRYKGLDPESQSNNALPPLRIITAGIQISL